MVNTTLFWMQTSLRKKALQVNRKALGVNKTLHDPAYILHQTLPGLDQTE